MCLKTKVTTSICRHHLIQTQAWRVPIYMHRHNDYDDVKDNGDDDAVVNDLDDRDFLCWTEQGQSICNRVDTDRLLSNMTSSGHSPSPWTSK